MKKWTAFILFFLAGSLLAQFADNFNKGTADNWFFKTPARWTTDVEYGRTACFINTGGFSNDPGSKVEEYALIKNRTWSDFSFSCLARSREDFSENPSADFCIVFGYRDDANYYYMMFNRWSSETKLYKIVGDERIEIATAADFWIPDNEYGIVEIRRAGGMITVRYGGDILIAAYDTTFGAGQIGIGSFNDAASFDDVLIEDRALSYDRAIRMTSLVSPFVIDDPAGNKSRPVIDVTLDGSFVLAWQNETGKELWGDIYRIIYAVYAQGFSWQGAPLTSPIQVNSGFTAISPAIAASDDRFVVSWTDFPFGFPFLDNSRGISAAQFTLAGSAISSGSLVWSPDGLWDIVTDQSTSDVAYPGTNGFAAVWSQRVFMGQDYEVYGNKVPANDGRIDSGLNPHIAADGEGRFLVVWNSGAQAFSKEGNPLGEKFHAADAVSTNWDGDALITWTANDAVYGQRCTTSGTLVGGEFQISTGGASDVSVNRRGEACTVWESATDGVSNIHARFMKEDGIWSADAFFINSGAGFWHDPKAVFLENCLYSVCENREDTSIVAAVHLLDNYTWNYAPGLISTHRDTAREDMPYQYQPTGTDPNGGDILFSFADYPAWLVPGVSEISGTPLQGDGDTSFVVITSDGALADTTTILLTVIPVNDPPRIVNLSDFEFLNSESYPIPLDLCVVDDDSAQWMTWVVLPGNDSLEVTLLENRVVLFSAPGWFGTTPVLFRVTDPDGASDSLTVTVTVTWNTGVPEKERSLPTAYTLYPVWPNPFNPATLISFGLPVASECWLTVYNLRGESIAELFRGRKEAGNHSVTWDAGAFPSGTYLIRLRAGGFVRTQKCTLVK